MAYGLLLLADLLFCGSQVSIINYTSTRGLSAIHSERPRDFAPGSTSTPE